MKRTTDARFRTIFELASSGIALLDEHLVYKDVNPEFCRLTGRDRDTIVGKKCADLIAPGHEALCSKLHEVLADGGRWEGMMPVARPDGSVVDVEWRLIAENGHGVRIAIATNVTEREKLLESERAARTEAERSNRLKDEFLATLSHELRNPLAPMRSALDVLKLKFGHGTDTRLLQAFDRQLRHLTRLVDDLMEVSRITQGRMQVQRAPVELSSLVFSAAHDLAATMEAARHTLRLSIAEPPVVVDGDATRLAQVVINLLTNAAKYTPDGGTIELRLSCDDGTAEISVRDNGIGLPASALATVFNMFSQLEPALERSKGGLGIGLALVRGIVELHGGSVHADSPGVGLGSTFTLRLPLAQGSVCAPSLQAPSGTAAPAQLRVLVVDDNEDAAETLAMTLALHGCEVKTAATAARALEMLPGFAPAAALLDIGLPDMNGYELARRMRQLSAGGGITLIATTGWGQQKDRERAFAAGFDRHLTKPIDFDLLRSYLPN
jgi:PAS domain S-box-containing protein